MSSATATAARQHALDAAPGRTQRVANEAADRAKERAECTQQRADGVTQRPQHVAPQRAAQVARKSPARAAHAPDRREHVAHAARHGFDGVPARAAEIANHARDGFDCAPCQSQTRATSVAADQTVSNRNAKHTTPPEARAEVANHTECSGNRGFEARPARFQPAAASFQRIPRAAPARFDRAPQASETGAARISAKRQE